MDEHPLTSVVMLGVGIYLFALWRNDCKSRLGGNFSAASIPGATTFSTRACFLGALGAVVLVLGVSALEWVSGTFENQRSIRWFFLGSMLGASVVEEVVFRGYLVVQGRGKVWLIASCVLMSGLFALVHPYLWIHAVEAPSGFEWISQLRPHLSLQSLIATSGIFVYSLWFYACRFSAWNPHRSLAPCFCAHAIVNLTVFAIKALMGFVV